MADTFLDPTAVLAPTPQEFKAKYKVTKKLGQGAFAAVYRVVEHGSAVPIALKVHRTPSCGSALESEVLFFREARAMKHASGHR